MQQRLTDLCAAKLFWYLPTKARSIKCIISVDTSSTYHAFLLRQYPDPTEVGKTIKIYDVQKIVFHSHNVNSLYKNKNGFQQHRSNSVNICFQNLVPRWPKLGLKPRPHCREFQFNSPAFAQKISQCTILNLQLIISNVKLTLGNVVVFLLVWNKKPRSPRSDNYLLQWRLITGEGALIIQNSITTFSRLQGKVKVTININRFVKS